MCYLGSQEHCTDRITGFLIRKLFAIPLITFFGNNFLLPKKVMGGGGGAGWGDD